MYDPEQLRTFLTVAQSLSFTRAAENLGLGQPTVSQHIRKLESAVGRPLFIRDTRSVVLTADGEAMARFARSILAAHEQAVAYFTGSGLSGRLRFGVTDDLALTPVPSILREFRELCPRIDLEHEQKIVDSLQMAFYRQLACTRTPASGEASHDQASYRRGRYGVP
jgi:DNA-binding transcriptional LysR family regulator